MSNDARSLRIESGPNSLEALLEVPSANPAGILVVCHPHPLYGGSMHNNVVDALCNAAVQEGFAALRFNFRGVGQSGGVHDAGSGEQEDVLAALAAASEFPGGASIGLAGYSFGAGTATRAMARVQQSPRLLILVSPPLRNLHADGFGATPAERLLITGDLDQVCPAAALEAIAATMLPSPDCIIVEGADHSWFGYEAQLRDASGSFLRWHLTPQ
jgi:alpha/beta superfamily hydrolase